MKNAQKIARAGNEYVDIVLSYAFAFNVDVYGSYSVVFVAVEQHIGLFVRALVFVIYQSNIGVVRNMFFYYLAVVKLIDRIAVGNHNEVFLSLFKECRSAF